MPRFRLLSNIFTLPGKEGQRYKKGDTIKTDLPLDEMFKNKFVNLDDVVEEGGTPQVIEKLIYCWPDGSLHDTPFVPDSSSTVTPPAPPTDDADKAVTPPAPPVVPPAATTSKKK